MMHKFITINCIMRFFLREVGQHTNVDSPWHYSFVQAMTGSVTCLRDPHQPGIARVCNGKTIVPSYGTCNPTPPNRPSTSIAWHKFNEILSHGNIDFLIDLVPTGFGAHPWCCYMHGHATCIEISTETSHPGTTDGGGSIEFVS